MPDRISSQAVSPLKLLTLGYSVIPSGGGESGKAPLVSWTEYQRRLPTEVELEGWESELQPSLWGIVTGEISKVFILDIDKTKQKPLMDRAGLAPHIKTPKGWHYWFVHPGHAVITKAGIMPGIDIRGDGGFVNCTGRRKDGGEYKTLIIPTPDMLYTWEQLPQPIKVTLTTSERKAIAETPSIIKEGARNQALASLAGTMRRRGMSKEAIEAALIQENQARCEPPLDREEIKTIAGSISRYPPAAKPGGNSSKPEVRDYKLSDAGMGERLADMYRNRIRYVHLWRQWLIYCNGRWCPDKCGEVKLLAKLAVRSMYADAGSIEGIENRRKYLNYVLASESERRINAALIMAASEPGVATNAEDLDTHPWLLNVKNGTIDLETCKLRAHNPDDLLTRVIEIDFKPEATSKEWDAFLATTFNSDQGLIQYIRRAVGYTLNGTQCERVFFFCHGLGRNGKSQFLAALRQVLGSYAFESKPDVFMQSKFKANGPDEGLAALRGTRLLTATEVKRGHEINAGLIKRMTGGEPLWHEKKFQHGYSYQPTHTLWLSGNHEPRIKDTTDSIWDRLKKVPFLVRIPEAKEIKAYGEKLAKAHGPAILAWMVKGANEYHKAGLSNEPDIVKTATNEYRAHQDILHDFANEKLQESPGNNITLAEVYCIYCEWCKENDQDPIGKRAFNEAMRERGYHDQRGTNNKSEWRGVTLVT